MLLIAKTSSPMFRIVSIGSRTTSGAASSITLTTTATAPKDSRICVGIGWGGAVAITSVSDGTNTYTLVKTGTHGIRGSVYLSSKLTADLASGSTITVTFASTIGAEFCISAFYANGLTGSSDGETEGVVSTTSVSQATSSFAQTKQLVVGFLFMATTGSTSTVTTGSGWTRLTSAAGFGGDICSYEFAYKIAEGTAAQTYTATLSVAPISSSGIAIVSGLKRWF